MAQHLQPGRPDNRGGKRPKTSTKKMFTHRVEQSKHAELKEVAIRLNKEVEESKATYTIWQQPLYRDGSKGKITDRELTLSYEQAIKEKELLDAENVLYTDELIYTIVKNESCKTTEK
jgi:hypothetical protein